MKTKIQLLICSGLFLFLFAPVAEAQILQTREQVLESYGEPFSSGVSRSGENYMFYKVPVKTETSGTFYQCKVLYFKPFANGSETCYKWKIIEPASEAPDNISSFTRQLVQLDDLKWKDFDKGIIYEMEVGEKACKIIAKYDGEAALAKVYKVN